MKKTRTICPAMGCRKKAVVRGVCRKHYDRWRKLEDQGNGPLSRIEAISNPPRKQVPYERELVPVGARKVYSNGFTYVKVPPDHLWGRPDRPKGTWVLEHRLVMMEHLNRDLKQGEVVKHKDGDKTNNDIANLYIVGDTDEEAS